MTKPLFRHALQFFAMLCLSFGLLALPVNPALAGQTITIDTPVVHDVAGNSPKPDGEYAWGDTVLDPNNNTVNINNDVTGYVYGGVVETTGADATANSNTINVNSGMITSFVFGGYAQSDTGSATTNNNTVNINTTGTITGRVYGGYAGTYTGSATATGNTVNVNNGTVTEDVFGGRADVWTDTGVATAINNTVNISGGTITSDIYGGYAESDAPGSATASGNTVSISGGVINGDVLGGHAGVWSGAGPVTATNNTVTLSGSASVSGTVYGGRLASTSIPGDVFTGNTLNIKSSGLTVNGVQNFEFLNFYLPTTFAAGGTMLTVTGTAQLTENADGTGRSSKVNVGIDGASSPLKQGDQVVLIDASAGTLVTNAGLNTTAGMLGVTLKYEFDIAADTTAGLLTATVSSTGPQVNEQTKALSEGFVSGAALVNQTGDLAAGQAMWSAVGAAGGKTQGAAKQAKAGAAGGYGFGTFGALSGGSMRYNTGSHVDMASLSLIAGLSFGADLAPGRLTLGAFFEYGNGSYNTYNSFSNAASVDGKGNLYHLGGGVLGRMDFMDTGPGNFYTEASFRAGGVHNDYKNGDLRDAMGRKAEYDSDSAYYGFHLGTGYIWNITEKASLDLYGKYFWTRQQGDSVTLSTGDPVKFKDVDSSRLRLGGRFAYAVNEYVSPYIGAAYEHEFDGKARATTNGFSIPAPSLRGDTGIGELGLTLKPSKDLPLSFDLGVQGYVGKREGVTGSLQVRFEF